MAVWSRYTLPTLRRLAEFGPRTTRRAAVMAVTFLGGYESNHLIGRALCDEDRGVRLIAENGIRGIWCRAGNPAQRRQIDSIVRLNNSGQYQEAIESATDLLRRAPWYAEAWSQRGIAHFSAKRHSEAIRDCHQALEFNPYHYPAAIGMGQCYLALNDSASALESFRRALNLNPNLEGVRAQVTYLERTGEEK